MALDDFILHGVDKQVFIHNGLRYAFYYKIDGHEMKCSRTVKNLKDYMAMIKKKLIPNYLFNNRSVPRASRMRIKNLSKSQRIYLQQFLFREKKVIRMGVEESSIPRLVDDVFKNFKKAGVSRKPNHDPVLNYILRKDDRSIAIEMPVWREGTSVSNCLTGHIDLVQLIQDKINDVYEIRVCDYKPEGENKFLFPIPQVALYGLMLRDRIKKGDDALINCYIFDRKAIWKFSPDILHDIDAIVSRFKIERDWNGFI
ncbi:hypothetical protein GF325_10895 [Candidatus Bathyarchaeota archaeon]|nr:hypothetical protein [Candidatus Bathyarchaeota archaeon]